MHKEIKHTRIFLNNYVLRMRTLLAIHCYNLTVKLHMTFLRSATVIADLSVECGLSALQRCEEDVQTPSH
jgi:hypothetical protein